MLDSNLKSSYQIASLFHMYIDMGERTAGKQDRPSLITEAPHPKQAASKFSLFWSHLGQLNFRTLKIAKNKK